MCWQITSAARRIKQPSITSLTICGLLLCISSVALQHDVGAADGEFYTKFQANIQTNKIAGWLPVTDPVLIDRSNTNAKATVLTISLSNLMSRGEIGPIHLGMTMDEAVAKWGRPKVVYGRCYGGHRLAYSDCDLVFRSNTLFKIMLPRNPAFDRAASTRWNLASWTNLLGQPSFVITNRPGTQKLIYETRGDRHTAFLLSFYEDGNPGLSPTLYLDPVITNSQPYFP